jgi:thymidylate synthase ThyX
MELLPRPNAWSTEAPIFVFREWHRHRTAKLNEMSARYTVMPTEWADSFAQLAKKLDIHSQLSLGTAAV